MKKLLSTVLIFALTTFFSISAFAQSNETQRLEEVPVTPEIADSIKATITHEDGTQEVLIPVIKVYKVLGNSRGSQEQYKVEVSQNYLNKNTRANSGSDSDSTEAQYSDAKLKGVIYFSRVGTTTYLDEIDITFVEGEGVQLYNRTVEYGTFGVNKTVNNAPYNYYNGNPNISTRPGNAVDCSASCDINNQGFKDSMSIKII